MNGTLCPTCGEKAPMMTDEKHYVCTICGDGWIFEVWPTQQLCPFDDCRWHIAPAFDRPDETGWYQCGHCECMLWAEPVEDSDYVDWHTWTAGDWLKICNSRGQPLPGGIQDAPIAFALASSWASPPEAQWDREAG